MSVQMAKDPNQKETEKEQLVQISQELFSLGSLSKAFADHPAAQLAVVCPGTEQSDSNFEKTINIYRLNCGKNEAGT